MGKKTVLIVDDELKIRILLRDFLERDGFKVLEAADGKQALEIFQNAPETIDLVLLDIMLPIYDGWTVCREIRKVSETPIIMLTARSQDFDEVHGFDIGANDYVTKPVKPSALMARINAMFRRMEKGQNSKKTLLFNGLEIDADSHQVKLRGEPLLLSPKEYLLLLTLVENRGRVISREQLFEQVWGADYFGGLRSIDTHINRLRIKMGDKGNAIITIRGFGYKFEEPK